MSRWLEGGELSEPFALGGVRVEDALGEGAPDIGPLMRMRQGAAVIALLIGVINTS